MAEFVFYHEGEPLDRERVDRLFRGIADQTKIDLLPRAILELPLDYARLLVSVDDGKPQQLFGVEFPENGEDGQVYVTMLKPPHGLPYPFPVAKIEHGQVVLRDQLWHIALAELRYVVISWLRALHEPEEEEEEAARPYLGIVLNPDRRTVTRQRKTEKLCGSHFKLFEALFSTGEQGQTRDQLVKQMGSKPLADSTIKSYASRMSEKLEQLGLSLDLNSNRVIEAT